MQLPNNATVAVADGQSLGLFRNHGTEGHPALTALDAPSLQTANAGSGGRHNSSSANPSESQQSEDGFAAAAAAWLNKQVLDGKIEQLVVIAAPRTLGELRKHYHKQLQAVLVGELHKDLAGRPAAEVAAAIAAA